MIVGAGAAIAAFAGGTKATIVGIGAVAIAVALGKDLIEGIGDLLKPKGGGSPVSQGSGVPDFCKCPPEEDLGGGSGVQGSSGNDKIPDQFEGVPIFDSNIGGLPQGAAFTIPQTGIYLSKNYWNKQPDKMLLDLLRHEFGHILQKRKYGSAYGGVVVPVSVLSALQSQGSGQHQNTWTEREANTLSYLYFGMPSDWNTKGYPVDYNLMNELIKSNNYERKNK